MKRSNIYRGVIVAVAASLLLATGSVRAATGTKQAGISVSPAQLIFKIDQQTDVQIAEITISNTYDTTLRLAADLRDIDETNTTLIPTGSLSDQALAGAIVLSATDISVPAHGTYQLRVEIHEPQSLPAGGHYASLVLQQQTLGDQIPVYRSAVAVNLFVINTNKVRNDLRLTSEHTNRWLFGPPSSATVTFKNLGNAHVVPRASISLYTADGQTLISQGVANTDSKLIFPSHEVSFTVKLISLQRVLLPKKLQLRTVYRIDGSDIQLLAKQSFWYIPPVFLVGTSALVGVVGWTRKRWLGWLSRGRFVAEKMVMGCLSVLRRLSRWLHIVRTLVGVPVPTPVIQQKAGTIRLEVDEPEPIDILAIFSSDEATDDSVEYASAESIEADIAEPAEGVVRPESTPQPLSRHISVIQETPDENSDTSVSIVTPQLRADENETNIASDNETSDNKLVNLDSVSNIAHNLKKIKVTVASDKKADNPTSKNTDDSLVKTKTISMKKR
jgi:hypothetical protein